jgi:hypothetical protein
LESLLQEIELTVSQQCLLTVGLDRAAIDHLFPVREKLDAVAKDGADVYAKAWGSWQGKEEDFFIACAEYATDLDIRDILSIGSPRLRIRYQQFMDQEADLHDKTLPERLVPGAIKAQGDGITSHLLSYQSTDVIEIPTPYLMTLHCFNPQTDVANAIEAAKKMGIVISEKMVRNMMDFRILVRP